MAITLRGTNSANSAGSFDIFVPMPAGIATDDVAYAFAADSVHTTDFDVTTTSTGWTELAESYSNDTTDVNACLMRKVQGGTPDSSVRFRDAAGGSFAWSGVCIALTGADTTTPEDATTTTATGTDGEDPDPPSITTVTNGAWVLAFGASSEGDDITNAPSGYSNLVDNGVAFGNPGWTMAATKEVTTAGAENPGAFTDPTGDATDSWVAFTVAVRPAAGGGGGPVSVTPTAVSAAGTVVAPTVVLGSITIGPAAAAAKGDVVAPTVRLGSLTVAPAVAAAKGDVVAPAVVQASMTVAPAVATAKGDTVNPSVFTGGSLVSPTAASASGIVVDPTVRLGSHSFAPVVATAVGAVVTPTVIVPGSGLVVDAGASEARGDTIGPTVVEAPGRKFGTTDEPLGPFWTPENKPSYSPWI